MKPVPYVGKDDDEMTAHGQKGKWGNRIRLNCYLDPSDVKLLQEKAEENCSSLASIIRIYVKKGLGT